MKQPLSLFRALFPAPFFAAAFFTPAFFIAAFSFPSPATAQTCATCPPGTVMVEVSGPPPFKNCTAAYDYYVGERYEYLLTVLLQNEALFSPAYQAVCERRQPESFATARLTVTANRARLTAESDAITAVMAELIRTDVAQQVPATCRDDRAAQEESIVHTATWIETSRDTYGPQALDYAENTLGALLECKHFTSGKAAYIYELDLKDDIALGVAAAQAYMMLPDSVEMKDTFVRYKTARDRITHPRTARAPATNLPGAAP